jgi:diguanylate cyclase (GGDEF)-like protein
MKMSDQPAGRGGIGSIARGGGQALLDDLACPVLEVTPAGRLRFANAAAVELLGLSDEDLNKPLLARLAVSPAGQRRLGRRLALLLAQRVPSLRLRLRREPQDQQFGVWRLSLRRSARGRIVGITAMAENTWLPHGLGRLPSHAAELAAHRPFHGLACDLKVGNQRRLARVGGPPVDAKDGHCQGHPRVGGDNGGAEHAAERVRYLVRHDPLTGLVNRQALGESLGAALDGARHTGGGLALLALDLEDFKRVNDSYGHRVGDQLLQQAAERLRRSVAGSDVVARLGGDEFAVVVPLPEPRAATAIGIAERIAERLRRPFGIDSQEIHCGVRIGITISPLHGDDVATLLQQADLALHEAKRQDDGICVFGAELSAATQRRKAIEDALRRALARDEMSLVLQPQFAMRSQALVGCEALLRWRNGQPDEIGPAVFVPIAEETGLIVALGSWVLREACRLAAGWWQGGRGPRIAVNLSPMQFASRDLCREVAEALAAARLPPEALELEITEGLLMQDKHGAAETLNKLNELGVGIALDDFGTGYSSLSYLKRFPIHRLKIDRTFIEDLDHDEDDRQITKAIIGLGHSLNLEVVAEGVETPRQLAFLADLDCDIAQGYLFAPPMTAAAFKAALRDRVWPSAGVERRAPGRRLLAGPDGRSSMGHAVHQS